MEDEIGKRKGSRSTGSSIDGILIIGVAKEEKIVHGGPGLIFTCFCQSRQTSLLCKGTKLDLSERSK